MAGPQCRVCAHKQRSLLELGLVSKVPVRVLAQRFGVSKDSLFGHRRNHMSPQLRAALLTAIKPSEIDLDQLRNSEGRGLLGSLIAQRARLQLLSELAFQAGEVSAAVSVERAIMGSLELTSRLVGMLISRHEVTHTNILISSDYLQLRGAIVDALKPFPEAARVVGAALHRLETAAAEQIKADAAKGKPILIEAVPEEVEPC